MCLPCPFLTSPPEQQSQWINDYKFKPINQYINAIQDPGYIQGQFTESMSLTSEMQILVLIHM